MTIWLEEDWGEKEQEECVLKTNRQTHNKGILDGLLEEIGWKHPHIKTQTNRWVVIDLRTTEKVNLGRNLEKENGCLFAPLLEAGYPRNTV